jgi:uncharacterized OB-fold protein
LSSPVLSVDTVGSTGAVEDPTVEHPKDRRIVLTSSQVPLVDYLVLGDDPHLVAHQCVSCGARFFDRRNACAACFATEFETVRIATEGELTAFTIVAFAAPGVPVPFVAGVIDCDGTSVRGNIVNTAPDDEHVKLGMRVRLVTTSLGLDDDGVEAIGFAFEPVASEQ